MSKLEFHMLHSVLLSKGGSVRHLGSKQLLHVTVASYTFPGDDSPLPKPARLYLYQVHGE